VSTYRLQDVEDFDFDILHRQTPTKHQWQANVVQILEEVCCIQIYYTLLILVFVSGMKEGDMSWVTGDTNDNKIKKERHNDNTLERLIQAQQHMWTWTMLYGNIGNWPAGLCQVYLEMKEEEVSGKAPQAVADWCVLLCQQLLDSKTILHEAYMVNYQQIWRMSRQYFVRVEIYWVLCITELPACRYTLLWWIPRDTRCKFTFWPKKMPLAYPKQYIGSTRQGNMVWTNI
jgi:hypothetical protein